jgi:hypothetical protein
MKVFGQRLSALAIATNRVVPAVLESCFAYLLPRLDTTGLFRVPGSDAEVKRLESHADATGNVEFSPNSTPFAVANCLTRFVKRIPGHLLDDNRWAQWARATTVELIQAQLEVLPRVHRAVLSRILAFFTLVCAHSGQNRMDPSNVSIILSPIMIENKGDLSWLLPREVISPMLEHYKEVFGNLSALEEDGSFMSQERYELLIATWFSDVFLQATDTVDFHDVIPEKQQKMCRRFQIERVDWEPMFQALMAANQRSQQGNTATQW